MAGPQTGWGLTAAYYDTRDFTTLKRIRLDPTVNFDWSYGSSDAAIECSTFSMRWTGHVLPRARETYTFYTQYDDGVCLWVNNQFEIRRAQACPLSQDCFRLRCRYFWDFALPLAL